MSWLYGDKTDFCQKTAMGLPRRHHFMDIEMPVGEKYYGESCITCQCKIWIQRMLENKLCFYSTSQIEHARIIKYPFKNN